MTTEKNLIGYYVPKTVELWAEDGFATNTLRDADFELRFKFDGGKTLTFFIHGNADGKWGGE